MAPLLSIERLDVRYESARGDVRAVDGLDLALESGETYALVGESGCGKTATAYAILRLVEPGWIAGGRVVFQDPYSSLDPRMRVQEILLEGMRSLDVGRGDAERLQSLERILAEVGLPADALGRYPHEFSGGQRQRIAIARALAVSPRLIVCDEPTSALDVSVQAQILNLLRSLQERTGIAYLFITHNIAVVEYLAHEVAVMHEGRIVERGTAAGVLRNPQHPYTRKLLAAVPRVDEVSSLTT